MHNDRSISDIKEITWNTNLAKRPLLDEPIYVTEVTVGIPIEENPKGDILVESYTDRTTGKNFYYRVYVDNKLKSSNWIKKFSKIE